MPLLLKVIDLCFVFFDVAVFHEKLNRLRCINHNNIIQLYFENNIFPEIVNRFSRTDRLQILLYCESIL